MKLDPLTMAEATGGRWDPGPPAETPVAVSQDTRRLKRGAFYVALEGPRHDGHDFVAAARRAGAAAAMVAESFHEASVTGWPLLRVRDTRQALRHLAAAWRRLWQARVVGVTGSVGKTTVKDMIAHLLKATAGDCGVVKTFENWNNDIGLPLSLLNSPPHAAFGIFEIGTNHPGEILPLAHLLQPHLGVVTAVGPAHVEHFGDTLAIAHEKADLLRVLPPDGVAVLNHDHAYVDVLREAAPCRVVTVSMQPQTRADYHGTYRENPKGTMPSLDIEDSAGRRHGLPLPAKGRHQAANLLLAAVTARQLGMQWETMPDAAASFEMPPMRWQRVRRDGRILINDAYNANPMSMYAALETFAGETAAGERRWLVLGGMLEMGEQAVATHRDLGKAVARRTWQGLITVGDLARHIADGAREAGFPAGAVVECATIDEAAARLRDLVKPGDAVLLKGSRGFQLDELADNLAW